MLDLEQQELEVHIPPAQADLMTIWLEYQTRFDVMQRCHTVARTVVPAAFLQRYNNEMVAASRAKLALRETDLAAAKTMKTELDRLRADESLTGNHAACTIRYYMNTYTTEQEYKTLSND
jgi:hypothetical protein